MINRELSELIERLKKASDRELSQIYQSMNVASPLNDPKNRLVLPSVIRAQMIKKIETWIRNGDIKVKKDA